jgi:hypothetical protein
MKAHELAERLMQNPNAKVVIVGSGNASIFKEANIGFNNEANAYVIDLFAVTEEEEPES